MPLSQGVLNSVLELYAPHTYLEVPGCMLLVFAMAEGQGDKGVEQLQSCKACTSARELHVKVGVQVQRSMWPKLPGSYLVVMPHVACHAMVNTQAHHVHVWIVVCITVAVLKQVQLPWKEENKNWGSQFRLYRLISYMIDCTVTASLASATPSAPANAYSNLETQGRVCCRALAKSQQEALSLEQRLGKAEQAESEALRELREAESAAVDQESLLLRASALEDKVKEYRAEQGQLETYKQVRGR